MKKRLANVHGTTSWKNFADLDLVVEAYEGRAWELLGGTEYRLFRAIRQHRRRPPPARGAEAVPPGREPALTQARRVQHRPAEE